VILKSLEYWVLAQVGLEVILICLLIFFLMKIRSMGKLIHNSQEDEQSASGRLEHLADQLASLEARRIELEESLNLLEEKAFPANKPEPARRSAASGFQISTLPKSGSGSLRLQVEDLHSQGFSSGEIAHRLGLHPTELKMALELSRLKAERA
jgi:cell division protein FtsB